MDTDSARPAVTELRLSAFKAHRGTRLPLTPLTLLAGASGSGKSSALQAYELLARLGGGASLDRALGSVTGGAAACVPEGASPDGQGRRGFRVGCTVAGPAGPVRLDLSVQTEPELRVVGERLTGAGHTLLSTALIDPGRRAVQAAWHTAGAVPVTRAPLPDDLLATALLPLRVAGRTAGQRLVLAAAEQVVIALRSVFACDPRPPGMRAPADGGGGRLRSGCDNLPAVLARTGKECVIRHAALVEAVRAGCAGPVGGLRSEAGPGGLLRAVVERGERAATPLERLGDGELRYLALALVLLTGPGVLEVDAVGEVPQARQALTVVADGLDRCLDGHQTRELLSLAVRMAARGHIRLVGTVRESAAATVEGMEGVSVLRLPGARGERGRLRVSQGGGRPEA